MIVIIRVGVVVSLNVVEDVAPNVAVVMTAVPVCVDTVVVVAVVL